MGVGAGERWKRCACWGWCACEDCKCEDENEKMEEEAVGEEATVECDGKTGLLYRSGRAGGDSMHSSPPSDSFVYERGQVDGRNQHEVVRLTQHRSSSSSSTGQQSGDPAEEETRNGRDEDQRNSPEGMAIREVERHGMSVCLPAKR